jgi:hypothetical protein
MSPLKKLVMLVGITVALFAQSQATQWVKSLVPGSGTGTVGGIATDGVYIYTLTGYYTTTTFPGSQDCVLAKYTQNGDVVWSQVVGGGYNEYPIDLAYKNGKLYVLYTEQQGGTSGYGSVLVTMDTNAGLVGIDWDSNPTEVVVPKKLCVSPDGERVYVVGEQTPFSISNTRGRRLFYTRYTSSGTRIERKLFSYGLNLAAKPVYEDQLVDAFVTATSGITVCGNTLYGNSESDPALTTYGYLARLGDGIWGPWAWYQYGPQGSASAACEFGDSFCFATTKLGDSGSTFIRLDPNLNFSSWVPNTGLSVFSMQKYPGGGTPLEVGLFRGGFLYGQFGSGSSVVQPNAAFPRAIANIGGYTYLGYESAPGSITAKALRISSVGAMDHIVLPLDFTSTKGSFSQFIDVNGHLFAYGAAGGGGGSDRYFGYVAGQPFVARLD